MNLYPANTMGFHDVYGNVWEWVEDHFNGFPGFKTNFLYDDFSSPCFDGRHNMILVREHVIVLRPPHYCCCMQIAQCMKYVCYQ